MNAIYNRTVQLIGQDAMEKMMKKRVLIFGIGGVGGYIIEALARTGIGNLGIVDCDVVEASNCNRQIIAMQSTIGMKKTIAMKRRISDINPDIVVTTFEDRVTSNNLNTFHLSEWDYIADAVDDVQAKLSLIEEAKSLGVPIISSMGTGNKIDPSRLHVSTIGKTHTCPLAKTMRKELGLKGIRDLKVVFSDEVPNSRELSKEGRQTPASIAFVPAAAGLLMASVIVRDLLKEMEDGVE